MLNPSGEHPFDPTEQFSVEELQSALEWRQSIQPSDLRTHRRDLCPHRPPCPTVAVCVEEIAWYLRHRKDLDADNLARYERVKQENITFMKRMAARAGLENWDLSQ